MTIDYDRGDPDLELGAEIFDLLNFPTSWIYRRVETIRFLTATSIRRQVSVDFEMRSESSAEIYPLAILVKQPLAGLDVWPGTAARYPC